MSYKRTTHLGLVVFHRELLRTGLGISRVQEVETGFQVLGVVEVRTKLLGLYFGLVGVSSH